MFRILNSQKLWTHLKTGGTNASRQSSSETHGVRAVSSNKKKILLLNGDIISCIR